MNSFTNRMARSVLIALVIVCVKPVIGQDPAADAQKFAEAEWKLFDAGSFEQMYDSTFDDSMKQQMSRDNWVQVAHQTADQRGKLVSRAVANKTNSMGIYRIIFSSQCTGGKVFEDISVVKRDSGWKVTGIWVRPNLE